LIFIKAKLFPKFAGQSLIAWILKHLTLLLLLMGQVCCALLIWFHHNPGQQSLVAVPMISGFVTLVFLVKAND
jgi:hypothetical protein